ncbi:MAG TPA: KTSC domain-containing protein, partial [Chloroflexia bacterium]|nr:KTSC domain-containing protein [Chloroflexia bacterium]
MVTFPLREQISYPGGGASVQRQPVDSTNLRSVGYDEEQQILEIEFI